VEVSTVFYGAEFASVKAGHAVGGMCLGETWLGFLADDRHRERGGEGAANRQVLGDGFISTPSAFYVRFERGRSRARSGLIS
jgi:hypothetical protein